MAKTQERKLAKDLYVKQGKSAKEIADFLSVSEKTVGVWKQDKKDGDWDALRNAHLNGKALRVERIKDVITGLTEQRLELMDLISEARQREDKNEVVELQKQAVKLDDGISKWNKTLENFDKENRVTLSIYLEVMDSIFKSLQATNDKLFIQTLDFQEQHLNEIALKLG